LKCDEQGQRKAENFRPESPFVVVCEGLHESGLVCALLRHLGIQNCDVTFPKKKMGKDGISEVVGLLVKEAGVHGIAVIRDADGSAAAAFTAACSGFTAPYETPPHPFAIHRGRHRKSAVFLMPGNGRNGATEHLLFDAFAASHAALAQCIANFEACAINTAGWADNDKAKMRMQCAVASFCEADPQCSLAFVWHKGIYNPLHVASPIFTELSDFLADFSS
jgi:hypothetical protein